MVGLPFRGGALDGDLHQVQGGVDAGLLLEAVGDPQPAGALGDQRPLGISAVFSGQVEHVRAFAGRAVDARVAGGGGGGEVAEQAGARSDARDGARIRCLPAIYQLVWEPSRRRRCGFSQNSNAFFTAGASSLNSTPRPGVSGTRWVTPSSAGCTGNSSRVEVESRLRRALLQPGEQRGGRGKVDSWRPC